MRVSFRGRVLTLATRFLRISSGATSAHRRDKLSLTHSQRSATNGSTLVARRAGIQQASIATRPSNKLMPPKVSGSVGLLTNRATESKRVADADINRPTPTRL